MENAHNVDVQQLPIVVIGGGIAGVSCAETMAIQCPDRSIKIISASPLLKVVNNLVERGYGIDSFDIGEESKEYFEDHYDNISIILAKVISLNASQHELQLDNGDTIKYDKLCICSGGKPKLIKGADDFQFKDYILGIRDTETVETFQKKLADSKRIVVVGNGGIATELVYEVNDCEIIWVIKDDSYGATFFDSGAAQFFLPNLNEESQSNKTQVSKRLKYTAASKPINDEFGSALGPDWAFRLVMSGISKVKNVKMEYNCEIRQLFKNVSDFNESQLNIIGDDNSWPIYVELTNGKILGCDFIVSATGVEPNAGPFLSGNNFKIADDCGILVDSEMRTSETDIYAAGDVCTIGWDLSPRWFQMRLWTQARVMGIYAARCISAHLSNSSPLMYFNFDTFTHVTKFFGYKVILLGLYNGQKLGNNYEILLRVTPKEEYIKVVMTDGRMQGVILIGDTDLEETFENLIINQFDLSVYGDDLLNSNIDIADYFD